MLNLRTIAAKNGMKHISAGKIIVKSPKIAPKSLFLLLTNCDRVDIIFVALDYCDIAGCVVVYLELESVFACEGKSVEFDYSFGMDDECFVTPVSVKGKVFNKTGVVSLDAQAYFDYGTKCALCASPVLRHARVPVKHFLVSEMQDEDNDVYMPVENMRLDLDSLVTEDVYLALPSRILCRDDCKGLCPMCGADLNEGSCGCKKPIDPRFEALNGLLRDNNS